MLFISAFFLLGSIAAMAADAWDLRQECQKIYNQSKAEKKKPLLLLEDIMNDGLAVLKKDQLSWSELQKIDQQRQIIDAAFAGKIWRFKINNHQTAEQQKLMTKLVAYSSHVSSIVFDRNRENGNKFGQNYPQQFFEKVNDLDNNFQPIYGKEGYSKGMQEAINNHYLMIHFLRLARVFLKKDIEKGQAVDLVKIKNNISVKGVAFGKINAPDKLAMSANDIVNIFKNPEWLQALNKYYNPDFALYTTDMFKETKAIRITDDEDKLHDHDAKLIIDKVTIKPLATEEEIYGAKAEHVQQNANNRSWMSDHLPWSITFKFKNEGMHDLRIFVWNITTRAWKGNNAYTAEEDLNQYLNRYGKITDFFKAKKIPDNHDLICLQEIYGENDDQGIKMTADLFQKMKNDEDWVNLEWAKSGKNKSGVTTFGKNSLHWVFFKGIVIPSIGNATGLSCIGASSIESGLTVAILNSHLTWGPTGSPDLPGFLNSFFNNGALNDSIKVVLGDLNSEIKTIENIFPKARGYHLESPGSNSIRSVKSGEPTGIVRENVDGCIWR